MKIILTALFIPLFILNISLSIRFVTMNMLFLPLIVFSIPAIFYLITHDKANTVRVFVCSLSVLPIGFPLVSIVFYLISIFLNDEYLRRVAHAKIIVFTGIDGSGKTSHSKVTAEWLRMQGIDCVYYHFFRHPIVTSLSILKAKILRKPVYGSKITYSSEFRRSLKRPSAMLRPLIQLIDNWVYIGSRLLLNILRGRWVICDRYFYDYYIRFKCLGYIFPRFLEFIVYKLTPRPHLLVVFDVNPLISYKRREGEHPIWYYILARREYHRLARELGGVILNTQRPFDVVQAILNKLIESTLIRPNVSKSQAS